MTPGEPINASPPDQRPSVALLLAGALARAGWSTTQIATALNLPPAFAAMLRRTAIRDGEISPGSDARLIAAAADELRERDPLPDHRTRAATAAGTRRTRRPAVALLLASLIVATLTTLNEASRNPSLGMHVTLLVAALGCLFLATRQYAKNPH